MGPKSEGVSIYGASSLSPRGGWRFARSADDALNGAVPNMERSCNLPHDLALGQILFSVLEVFYSKGGDAHGFR
jgi:hypothetical protein